MPRLSYQEALDLGFTDTELSPHKKEGKASVNIQQIPKTSGYLECLRAAPGNKLVQMDVAALEPVVLTELSRDPNMWQVYGTDIPNDIYLFVGSGMGPLKEGLTAHGYDPMNPTPEAISKTKKEAKKLRSVAKVVHLAASYGAGAAKIWSTLVDQGFDISLKDTKQLLADYWDLFAGVKAYEKRLKAEWQAQNGWFLNGRGCPMSVPPAYEKDILNRCIQSTGHTNLLTYLTVFDDLRSKRELDFKFVVCDFHDELIVECPEQQVSGVVQAIKDSWDITNKILGGEIPLKGDPEVVDCFAEFKVEGYVPPEIAGE